MRRFLLLFATREGHTRRIADRLAETMASQGFSPEVVDVAHLPPSFSLGNYCGAILAASVHRQKHQAEMRKFVKRHVSELERISTAFVSISLSQAGTQDTTLPIERRAQSARDAQRMIDTFVADAGWHPSRTRPVAGALMYSKYNFLLRLLMKRIARQAGADTDTSRDHVYTDWKGLDEFAHEVASSLLGPAAQPLHA